MGVTHKLIPQIKEFILEQKKANPQISCRNLSVLIDERFRIKVSKSSINTIFKETGLSMPAGRSSERKHKLRIQAPELLEKKEPVELLAAPAPELIAEKIPEPVIEQAPKPIIKEASKPVAEKIVETPKESVFKEFEKTGLAQGYCSGALFLIAADYILGGSYAITEIIKRRLNRSDDNILSLTASLAFMPLFASTPENLWPLTGIKISPQDLESYSRQIHALENISADISRGIADCLEECRSLKIGLSDGNSLYLDGQMHSVWSTPHIPYGFSSTVAEIKRAIDDYFFAGKPLIIFMAAGYDAPSKDFLSFLAAMDGINRKIVRLTICGNKFEDMHSVSIDSAKNYYYIFAAFPWQFVASRKVNKLGEFKTYRSEALEREVFAAELDIDLFDQNKQTVNLKGCALKLAHAEKTRLIILSNLPQEKTSPQLLCEAYLSRWPNLDEAFQDYSRKIELFTYTADSQAFFETDLFGPAIDTAPMKLKNILGNYLETLDAYLKWHLFPQGYVKETFSVTKSRFYDLKAIIKKESDYAAVSFELPPGYQFLKDLQYLCRRINERGPRLLNGLRLRFTS